VALAVEETRGLDHRHFGRRRGTRSLRAEWRCGDKGDGNQQVQPHGPDLPGGRDILYDKGALGGQRKGLIESRVFRGIPRYSMGSSAFPRFAVLFLIVLGSSPLRAAGEARASGW